MCLALESALMEYCIQFCHLQFKKDIGKLKWVQRKVMRTIKKLENVYSGQKILDLAASIYFIKRKLKGDLFAVRKNLQWRKALVMALCSLEARKIGLEVRHYLTVMVSLKFMIAICKTIFCLFHFVFLIATLK